MSIARFKVYQVIDGERDYQDALGSDRTDGAPRTVGDYLTMLRDYLAEADRNWVRNPGNEQALDTIRKIAGIAVHCMEDHGAPPRQFARAVTLPAKTPLSKLPVKEKRTFTKKALPKKKR